MQSEHFTPVWTALGERWLTEHRRRETGLFIRSWQALWAIGWCHRSLWWVALEGSSLGDNQGLAAHQTCGVSAWSLRHARISVSEGRLDWMYMCQPHPLGDDQSTRLNEVHREPGVPCETDSSGPVCPGAGLPCHLRKTFPRRCVRYTLSTFSPQ